MRHTVSEPLEGGLVRLMRTDTGVVLWTATRGGEAVFSYSREYVERWLTLGPLERAA